MEESEQQVAGLSTLADPPPVVSGQVGIAHNQLFSTLPWANGKEKDTPLGSTLSQKPVCQTITVLYQVRGEGPLTWQREDVCLSERENNNPFWVFLQKEDCIPFWGGLQQRESGYATLLHPGLGIICSHHMRPASIYWAQVSPSLKRQHSEQEEGLEASETGKRPAVLHWDLLHLNSYGNKSCSLHISRVLKGYMWLPWCILTIWLFKSQLYFTLYSADKQPL